TLNTAFFLRPSPLSFNVFSPALSVSGSVAPASSAASACRLSGGHAEAKRTEARLAAPTMARFMCSILRERVQDRWRVLPSRARSSSPGPRRAGLHAGVEQQDAPHLFDGVGVALGGVTRLHDQLGLDRLDVGGGVLDHTIVSLLDRPIPIDG